MKNPIKLWRMAQASVLRHVNEAKSLLQKRNRLMLEMPPKLAEAKALESLIRDAETKMAQAVLRCKELEAEIRMVSIQEATALAEKQAKDAAEEGAAAGELPIDETGAPAPVEAPVPETKPETLPSSSIEEGKSA